jgi:hypothetical protein
MNKHHRRKATCKYLPRFTLGERVQQASFSISELGTPNPVVIDEMHNNAWSTFGAAPSPAYVIDDHGQIVLRQVWVNPTIIEQTINELLLNNL